MYICKTCNNEFLIPETVNLDIGGIHDKGCVRRFAHPTIDICPHCRSINIVKKKLIQEVS